MKADLSVIVTSYNKSPDFIVECFNSLRDQTIEPREIILVDDGSKDPRAHADAISILLPKNVGVSKARDIGVRMSSGRLLLFVDADDKLAPDFIEQSLLVMEKYDIAYPNILMFGDVERNKFIESPEFIDPKRLLTEKCDILVTSMMHRRVYESLDGFKDLEIYEDWDFWIRAMCNEYTFKRAYTILWYRQQKDSRINSTSLSMRENIFHDITAPYEIKGGKICIKKGND